MGLFNGSNTTEDKKQKEIENYMEKYQLNTLDEKDINIIKNIFVNSLSTKLTALTTAFSGNAVDTNKLSLMSAIFNQNWIIIRKLDEISKKLDK